MTRWLLLLISLMSISIRLEAQPPPPPGGSVGDLMIAPTRVVFEGRSRSAEVSLVNTGSATATYRIFYQNLVMNENGSFAVAPKAPGELSAEELVRFSPKQITLAPGKQQSVRMQLRKPADLPDGEYRTHMVFRAIPNAEEAAKTLPGIKTEADPGKEKAISVNIKAIFGISIPIIVRHGETRFSVKLTDLRLVPYEKTPIDPEHPVVSRLSNPEYDTAVAGFTLEREGNQSVYGDLVFSWKADGQAPVELARVGGLAVYHNCPRRKGLIRFEKYKEKDLKHGVLSAAFLPMDGKKPFSETSITIP